MLYVSFVEIFATKSFEAWEDAGYSAAEGYRFSTMLFFAGMLLVFLLDRLVHLVADCASKRGKALCSASRANLLNNEDAEGTGAAGSKNNNDDNDTATAGPSSSSRAPSGTMSSVQRRTEILIEDMEEGGITKHNSNYNNSGLSERGLASLTAVNVTDIETSSQDNDNDNVPDVDCTKPAEQAVSPGREAPAVIEMIKNDPHCFALQKMGVLTAVSIAIHNFPEGLATFVAALADVKLGIGVAVAIAVHNVPEGICVAMPIYYATGSRWKGFMWGALSGVSEPLGGLVGYLALSSGSELAFAVVFPLVGGMMVYISVKELVPTALRYDPIDKVTTWMVIAGMVVMALSLVLFTL
jgi:zinc transporter, ZIP family